MGGGSVGNAVSQVADVGRSIDGWAILTVVAILAIALAFSGVAQRFLPWVADRVPVRYRQFVLATVPLLRLITIIGAIVLSVPVLIEPTFENLVGLFGAAGLAIGFALKDYASSLIAGVVTLYEAPYRPGDWVEIDGHYGEVKSIGLRSLLIVTADDTAIVIPHLKLWDHAIANANDGTRNLMCVAEFFLDPQHDGAAVRDALYDVALTSGYLQLEQPIAVVASEQLGATRYRLKAYPVDPRDQFAFVTDLTIRGKAVFERLGVRPARPPFDSQDR